jgi:hypothetical protein
MIAETEALSGLGVWGKIRKFAIIDLQEKIK